MEIILSEDDINYISEKYPKLKIYDNYILWEISFWLNYEWFIISDTYSIKILLESRDFSFIPKVIELAWRIEDIAKKYNKELEDVHINNDNTLCLIADVEEIVYFQDWKFNAPVFFESILEPFLYGMTFFEKKGIFPFWERAHWILGLLEMYSEWKITLENLFKRDQTKLIEKNMNIKWHHTCLCGSWKNIRSCHPDILKAFYKIRSHSK